VFGVLEELLELFVREWDEMPPVKVRARIPGATSMPIQASDWDSLTDSSGVDASRSGVRGGNDIED